MSSTRRAKNDSIFHQQRYASSVEFERGLLANLVAKRCALIDAAEDRELVWFIQFLSHQSGGLDLLAAQLIQKLPDRLQTREMDELGLQRGKFCNAEQVRKIRAGMEEVGESFPLAGESWNYLLGGFELLTEQNSNFSDRKSARQNPDNYSVDLFFEQCKKTAASNLSKCLAEICLDPSKALDDYAPWYFPRLIESLREFKAAYVAEKSAVHVTTSLGEKVSDILDYTFSERILSLMQGEARTGKTFAAKAWCEQRPGVARFVEVPAGNDAIGFFRALARGLGLGNFLQYKACEIRDRVESVLLTCDIVLVLDEAQRLWPQCNLRYGFPNRIVWVMTMANAGVPIAMISTPQFTQAQKQIEKAGWNSAQLTGRIGHFEDLPAVLSVTDLTAVAKSVLPEADSQVLRVLATYAQSSTRYLAAIDSISKRAHYLAKKDGRSTVTAEDVRKAMNESVIPADSRLALALGNGRKAKLIEPAPRAADLSYSAPDAPATTESRSGRNRRSASRQIAPVTIERGSFEAALTTH